MGRAAVTAELPPLADRSGPPYHAKDRTQPYLTALGFWVNHIDNDDPNLSFQDQHRHFECLAGQTAYNPPGHPGVDPPVCF